jgi:phosphoenolpyruvate carboxylase
MVIESESRKIPRRMSTQHPDNVRVPAWSPDQVIDGNAEVYEAYYAFETLGCEEVMWDSEGKDVDTRVVRKLFSNHWDFFTEHAIGRDLNLTYRIPNPSIEAVEKKVVVETLQNIPVTYDVASTVYKKDTVPIFQVILPFTTSGNELLWLSQYYRKAIVASEEVFLDTKTQVKDWIGESKPKSISVIPLVEDQSRILNVDKIIEPYIKIVKPKSLRVFIARSDPALNYGLINAILLSKIALSKLKQVENEKDANIYPIIGVGSKPFRGNLSPDTVDSFLQEYTGLATVTVQSAARYDYPLEHVKKFVKKLNKVLPNGEIKSIDSHEEENLITILQKSRKQYECVAEVLAPLVNRIAPYVPQRRARKLHIGLFGYSRNVLGVSLPRAITFAAALYSIGIPPEFVGAKVIEMLTDQEFDILQKHYVNLRNDFASIGGYVSWQNLNMLMEMQIKMAKRANMDVDKLSLALTRILADLKTVENKLDVKLGPRSSNQRKHENFTNNFLISYIEHEDDEAKAALIEAAKQRNCLG